MTYVSQMTAISKTSQSLILFNKGASAALADVPDYLDGVDGYGAACPLADAAAIATRDLLAASHLVCQKTTKMDKFSSLPPFLLMERFSLNILYVRKRRYVITHRNSYFAFPVILRCVPDRKSSLFFLFG